MPDGHKSWFGQLAKRISLSLPGIELHLSSPELVTSLSHLWDRTNINLVSLEDIFINVAVVFVVFKPFLLFKNIWQSVLCLYHMLKCFRIWAFDTLVCESSHASWQMKEGKLLFNWPIPCSIVILEKLVIP